MKDVEALEEESTKTTAAIRLALAALLLAFVGTAFADEPNTRTTIAQTEDVSPKATDAQPSAPKPSIMPAVGEWSGTYERTSVKWTNRALFTFTWVEPIRMQARGTLRFTVNGRCDSSICNRDIPFSAIQSRDGTQILVRSDDRTVWYTLWWEGFRLKGNSQRLEATWR